MTRNRPGQPKYRRYDPLAVLSYVSRYQRQNCGRSPSQRRIRHAFTISATSVVHNMLHRMERRGLLTITTHGRGLPSDLSVTEAGQAAVQEWQARQVAGDTAADQE